MKSPKDREKLRLGLVELPLEAAEQAEIDAAESRWDAWTLALARQELDEEARLN